MEFNDDNLFHTYNIHYIHMTKRLRRISLQWPHDIMKLLNKLIYKRLYLACEED